MPVHRLGFGAMRITGEGIWGEPKDPAECKRVLKRLLDLVMLPIPGTSKVSHLEQNVAASDLQLDGDEWRSLELAAKEAA